MENHNTTLLIVEDDERTLEELSRILKKHTALEIFLSSNPSEAIKIAENNKIDIGLLDLKLPEMSGLELASFLRRLNSDILLTIMTGYGEEETPILAKETGVVDFLEKPLNLQYLLATLRFQEREATIRKTLRNASDLLKKFFSMTEDGIVMTDFSRILVSNEIGKELYEKLKDNVIKKIKHNEKTYEYIVYKSGNVFFHHFKDITSAYETSRVETQVEMAKMVAHELHNSLTPIKLWLQEILSLDPKHCNFAETAIKAASEGVLQIDRLSKLTKKFKEISKEKIIIPEKINLSALILKLLSS
ncbi:MAG: response regulator, partial [Acidobacteria bacterium]|nr:response regulator [Acidobacteriota bacterium]